MEALRWAFERPMHDPTAKAVLVALADHANEQALCWPSVARLCLFTALAERTVRLALRRLAQMGAIALTERPGRLTLVTLTMALASGEPRHDVPPCTTCTPAPDAPPPRHLTVGTPASDGSTPAPRAPEPLRTLKEPSKQPSGRAGRGTRLPDDWWPDEKDAAFAKQLGLEPKAVAERFRDYWRAKPGQGGVKLDWSATFRNWCRTEADRAASKPAARNGSYSRGGAASSGDGLPMADPWDKRVSDYRSAINAGKRSPFWLASNWGPAPGARGCAVPADVLRRYGFDAPTPKRRPPEADDAEIPF